MLRVVPIAKVPEDNLRCWPEALLSDCPICCWITHLLAPCASKTIGKLNLCEGRLRLKVISQLCAARASVLCGIVRPSISALTHQKTCFDLENHLSLYAMTCPFCLIWGRRCTTIAVFHYLQRVELPSRLWVGGLTLCRRASGFSGFNHAKNF